MKRITLGLCALLVTICCGGVDAAPTGSESNETAAANTEATSAVETAATTTEAAAKKTPATPTRSVIKGMIQFEGKAPVRKAIDMSSEASCHGADEPAALDETVIVNDGGLANVVVSISKGLAKANKGKGTGKVTLRQKGCVYIPHVLAVQEGQSLEILNDDGVVHNVHSYSKRNSPFNQAQPAGAPAIIKEMGRKDKMFPVKCDMHAWMSCQVVVFDHKYFTVSSGKGAFELTDLPAGKYTITAQHETLGSQTAEVTVGETGTQELNFKFKP